MEYLLFLGIFLVEGIALLNRGGGPLVSHLGLTGITTVCVALWIWNLYTGKAKLRLTRERVWAYAAYAIFYAFFLMSFLFSKTPEFGLSELLLFGNAGIIFGIFSQVEFSAKSVRIFKWAILALATAEILYGSFIYVYNAFPRFAGTFLDLAQPYTSFGNDFADFLILPICIAAGFLFKKMSRITTVWILCLINSLLISGFVLTFSRAAWLALLGLIALALGWIAIQKKKIAQDPEVVTQRSAPMRFGAVVVLTVILISLLQGVRGMRFDATPILKKATFSADEGTTSVSERALFWKGAVQIIKDHPIFGTGVQSFRYVYPQYQTEFGITWDHPHNIFLKIGVENGVIASIAFLIFLAVIFISSLRFLYKNPTHIAAVLILGALGAFAHNLLDYNFIVSNFILSITALAVGFSFSTRAQTHEAHKFTAKIAAVIIGVAVVLFVTVGLHEGLYNYYFKLGRAAISANKLDDAVISLEKSKNLIFPRDTQNYLVLAYQKEFEKTGEAIWKEKEKSLLENSPSSIDAADFSKLSEIYDGEKNFRGAYEAALRALALDPQNRFKYYFQVLILAKDHPDIKTNDADRVKKEVKPMLADYVDALKGNVHNTVITDNPLYAMKLLELFGDADTQREIKEIYIRELFKFTGKYGVPTETIMY